MKIDIDAIAELARLEIEDREREKLESDMKNIISMVDNLPEIAETGDKPYTEAMILRQDEVKECEISSIELMKNAPVIKEGCFAVPKTV